MRSDVKREQLMRPQPTWPDRIPDKVTDIKGGVVDGAGVKHPIPLGFRLNGWRISLEFNPICKAWYWVGRQNLDEDHRIPPNRIQPGES